MTWAKFDDRFPSHVKVLRLSDAAFRLFVTAVCFSCEQLTDGAIDRPIPGTLPRAPQGRKLAAAIKELEEAELWEPTEQGWKIHDFHDWNPTAEAVQTKREAAKERMRVAREGRRSSPQAGSVPDNSPPSSPDVRANASRSSPNPVPVPVPVPSAEAEKTPKPPTGAFRLPRNWDPHPGVFVGTQVPEWAHPELLSRFRGYHCNGESERTQSNWVQSYVRWAATEWTKNPPQRPANAPSPREAHEAKEREERHQRQLERERDRMFAEAGIVVPTEVTSEDVRRLLGGIGR